MGKILQHLKTLEMYHLRHAEHHAENRTSLSGLDQITLFLTDPFYKLELRSEKRTAQWNHFDERRNLSLTMVKKNRTPTFIVFAI